MSWLGRLKQHLHSSSIHADQKADSGRDFFSNAQNFIITGGQFGGGNNTYNIISRKEAVFKLLEPYACLDATKDSSARHPPPRCHPETRLKIRERLMRWLVHEYDEWKMLWVRGSAGTGKSAVAQSFGDSCGEEKMHGASYFFSRTAGWNKVETVVPTIVYQLAVTIPKYRSLVGHQLANDPSLLRNSPPVQFRKLIVEPFATLQRRRSPRKPVVIILDGLDECEGEKAQREILEMITNSIRTNPDLPLRWLIFSRPEAHLKNAFSRNLECGREELIIDDECRENVERYVRDRFTEIRATYSDITPVDWPPSDELRELLDAVSGLFVFASTCLNYIDDPDEADPRSQLDSLLTFMRRSQGVVSRNPLAILDLLYSRILDDISPTVFTTTRRILAYMSLRNKFAEDLGSTQALANFLRLDQHTFYKAVRGLHSVMYIPEPEDAAKSELKFYHASFLDFLLDTHRSGKLVIGEQEALLEIIHSGIYWYEIDAKNYHADQEWKFDLEHKHGSLPDLIWASEDHRPLLSRSITKFVEDGLFDANLSMLLEGMDEGLLSTIFDIDFRCWNSWNVCFFARLCRLDPSTPVLRIEPSSPTDHQLLEYFKLVIGNGPAKPATFPLRALCPHDQWGQEYFFIGHGVKSVIVWRVESPNSARLFSLRCDREPSETHISAYKEHLGGIEWDDEKVGPGKK